MRADLNVVDPGRWPRGAARGGRDGRASGPVGAARPEPCLNALPRTGAKNQNEELKNTYTSQSDILGRTQSSHTREHSKTSGDATTTHSETTATGRFGIQKNTETDTYKVTQGDNSKTESSAIATDRFGNRSTTDTTTNTTKNGNTTVTQTRKDTEGTELKTESSAKFEDNKFTFGESVERKDNRFNTERRISRETELLPSREDKGFSQNRNGAVTRAQYAGNVLDAMGAKVELHSYKVPARVHEARQAGARPGAGAEDRARGARERPDGPGGPEAGVQPPRGSGAELSHPAWTSGRRSMPRPRRQPADPSPGGFHPRPLGLPL
jgi:hypothetical protein